MGTWDTGPFDNDEARTLAAELDEVDEEFRPEVIRRAVVGAADSTGWLDSGAGRRAVAAAALVAAGQRGGVAVDVSGGPEKPVPPLNEQYREIAARAVARVGGPESELAELWEESDAAGPWRRELALLRDLLRPEPEVRIEPWTADDLWLLRLANTPEMTAHTGGPETEEKLLDRQRRYLDTARPDSVDRMFRIRFDGELAGSVGYWKRTWLGEEVYETGWGVLPEFQGKGVAARAVRLALASAREEARFAVVHAYPSVHNAPSNALCRKTGFTFVAPCEFEHPPGHWMQCNDWRFELL
ncbi:GNAT family N-acetyltransferase [Amycolatopsis sp. YIM 10]|uniref:GNAT family N-acetyltransferase n=1 Tax=Amycolatopsis sp. YIM 10 TaxID=2653857 RepID=UPI0012907ADD|nr:GNAT family N-acetyltransferase [Amycolatopsis sp. YIM 10]QFU88692.1 Acetyltransferase (GNAT) family protein [Amycolatopsis sp. YIM 10]